MPRTSSESRPVQFPAAFGSAAGVALVTQRTDSLLAFHAAVLDYACVLMETEAAYATGLASLKGVPVPDELHLSRVANAWSVFERAMELGASQVTDLWDRLATTFDMLRMAADDQEHRLYARKMRLIRAARSVRAGADEAILAAPLSAYLSGAQVVYHDCLARIAAMLRLMHEHYSTPAKVWKLMNEHLAAVAPDASVDAFADKHASQPEPLHVVARSPALASEAALTELVEWDGGEGPAAYDDESSAAMRYAEVARDVNRVMGTDALALPSAALAADAPGDSSLPASSREAAKAKTKAKTKAKAKAKGHAADGRASTHGTDDFDLPPGWTAHYDREYKRHYFYNALRDEATWVIPEIEGPADAAVDGRKVKRCKTRVRKKRRRQSGDATGSSDSSGSESGDSSSSSGKVDASKYDVDLDAFVTDIWGSKIALDKSDIAALAY
ncbi:uncharacterized protein AMSG_05782 [Thecamonas trahens ATCC 50062]|uniref:WW domain-containing protein n=1 Tax=Thecamonas trahens ATCC 50062 TaxID=461836 RepID=A0A0L0DCQ9_THETB|nr:hypothetical protein AMSG_05782 [Thecamonas trahens ATCC 50062]KNC50025.1 hypothetical protein AMSG_05782 [Thecamonas trahens ATCC 50062]|eukprot:XP_013757192.1 hypothetical protein AMSG_05782 [Thecamonas trahens ATCC 50062]